jgi:hypothetical protein
MKWAEGLDKLSIFLYLAISLFAVTNIYSVDESLGKKTVDFLLYFVGCRWDNFHDENQIF